MLWEESGLESQPSDGFSLPFSESFAAACELGHDLHYPMDFNPNDMFIIKQVLRHNFDPRVGPYVNGDFNYNEAQQI